MTHSKASARTVDAACSVVCAFDPSGGSPAAAAVAAVAAGLAQRLGDRLLLVHATAGTALPSLRRVLDDEAQRLGALGSPTDVVIDTTPVVELLAREAGQRATRFVVVGDGAADGPGAGTVAHRLLRAQAVPVLVMNDPGSLGDWLRAGGPCG